MNRLALDLGTTTGFCIGEHEGGLISGTWDLRPNNYEGGGMRYVKFRKKLDEIHKRLPLTEVHYEKVVQKAKGAIAGHTYGGFLSILQVWCEENSVPYAGVTVQAIKIFACGKGNASKESVIAAMQARGFEPVDSNHADAIALWLCGKEGGLV